MLEIAAVFGAEFGYQWHRNRALGPFASVESLVLHYLRQTVVVLVIFVVRQFIIYPQADEHRYGHPYRQTTDIDERIDLVFSKVSKGNFKVISNHGRAV